MFDVKSLVCYILDVKLSGGAVFHWELRAGLVEDKTARLAADMRRAGPSRPRRAAGRFLIAAGERLAADCGPQPRRRVRVA